MYFLYKKKTGGSSCKDTHYFCQAWAGLGECQSNQDFMKLSCPSACGLCQASFASDKVKLRQESKSITDLLTEAHREQTVHSDDSLQVTSFSSLNMQP